MSSSISCDDFAFGTNIPSWNVTSGSGTLLYDTEQQCNFYRVTISFPGLPLTSPVNFLFDPPDCTGLIELSFPLATDFPSGMACLMNSCDGLITSATMVLVNSQSNITSHSDWPTINGTASCTPGGEEVMNTFAQGANTPRNSTAYGTAAHGKNPSSTFHGANWNASSTSTVLSGGLGGPPSNGTDGFQNSFQDSIATPASSGSPLAVSGQGMGNGAPPATPTITGVAATPPIGSDSLANADLPSTLLTITTTSGPGLNGSQIGTPPDGTAGIPGLAGDSQAASTAGLNDPGASPGLNGTQIGTSVGGTRASTGLAADSQAASPTGPNDPGASGTNPNLPSQTVAPHHTVDGQEIPDSGGTVGQTMPAGAQITGTNGAGTATDGGGSGPAQSVVASTCRCN